MSFNFGLATQRYSDTARYSGGKSEVIKRRCNNYRLYSYRLQLCVPTDWVQLCDN